MKIGEDYKRLREDVKALRFVNMQTGYNLDIREIIGRKCFAEKILHDEDKAPRVILDTCLTTAIIGGTMAIGALTGINCFHKTVPQGLGCLIGAIFGTATGWAIHGATIGKYERAYAMVEMARKYKAVYDFEGIEGLVSADLRFDQFLDSI